MCPVSHYQDIPDSTPGVPVDLSEPTFMKVPHPEYLAVVVFPRDVSRLIGYQNSRRKKRAEMAILSHLTTANS